MRSASPDCPGSKRQLGRAFLMVYAQPPKAPRGGAFHHLGLETDDHAALVRRLAARGFEFRNPVRRAKTFDDAMIAGPDDLPIKPFQCHEPEHSGIGAGNGH